MTSSTSLRIAVVGAGNIGGTLARRWAEAGFDVRLANSRGPETLADVVAGTSVTPVALDDVVEGADVVVLSVPFRAVTGLRVVLARVPEDVPVVDTGNYVPGLRDVAVDAIEAGTPETAWVSETLGRPLVKAFNTISARSIRERSRPTGAPGRIGLPVAADRAGDRHVVEVLVDAAGLDAVDGGSLAGSWRQQPGTPVYTADFDAATAATALELARPEQTAAWRQRMATDPVFSRR